MIGNYKNKQQFDQVFYTGDITGPRLVFKYQPKVRTIPVKAGNLGTLMGFGRHIIVRKSRKIEVKYGS